MRCPECRHVQKYREGTRCKKCNYQFVFRKSADGISDFALRQIIQRLSDNDQQAFTATQLALAICQSWGKKMSLLIWGVLGAMIAILFSFVEHTLLGVALVLILSAPIIAAGWWNRSEIPFHKARKLVDRYRQAHPIAALADGRAFQQQTASIDLENPQYAPERILVVERDDLVDMLIRNRFHLSHKTAVVSRSGYPEEVFAACREFLKNHPDTPMQVLHDASTPGFGLTAQLAADPKWEFAHQRLIDLGISRVTLDGGSSLPWLPPDTSRSEGTLSANPTKMLRAGRRVPVDYIGPKPLLNLLGTAMTTGSLALVAANNINKIIVDADGHETDDFG